MTPPAKALLLACPLASVKMAKAWHPDFTMSAECLWRVTEDIARGMNPIEDTVREFSSLPTINDAIASNMNGSNLLLFWWIWRDPTIGCSPPRDATPSWFNLLWQIFDKAPHADFKNSSWFLKMKWKKKSIS